MGSPDVQSQGNFHLSLSDLTSQSLLEWLFSAGTPAGYDNLFVWVEGNSWKAPLELTFPSGSEFQSLSFAVKQAGETKPFESPEASRLALDCTEGRALRSIPYERSVSVLCPPPPVSMVGVKVQTQVLVSPFRFTSCLWHWWFCYRVRKEKLSKWSLAETD